jgi:hypothetical protein
MGDKVLIAATANYIAAQAAYRSGPIPVSITIAGYSRVLTNYATGLLGQYDWISGIDVSSYTVHDLDGGADQGTFAFTVQDVGAAITADFPGFVFEGKQVTVKSGFEGLDQSEWITVFTGYIDTVASANSNNDYYFTCSDISARLSQVVYTLGDDGLPIDSSNPKTLLGHPLDILLDILVTKIGLAAGFVDSTKIMAYRDGIFNGARFQFNLTQAPAAADFIKNQLLKPLGGYLWVNSFGKISVNFFYPLSPPAAVATLNEDVFDSIPEAEQVDLVNTVQFQFDKDDGPGGTGNNYMSQDTETYAASVAKYGQYGETVIAADGLRSSLQGFLVSKMVSRMIFMRYGLKGLKFDQYAPVNTWQAMRLEPGDIVAVSHAKVPDRVAGVMGISGKLFEILDRSMDLAQGQVTLTMLDASYLGGFGSSQIAPTGEAAYAAASAGDKALYMFMCSDLDVYTNSDQGKVLA